jgi:hypothetical protein
MAAPADLEMSKNVSKIQKTRALSALHAFLIIGVAFEAFSIVIE